MTNSTPGTSATDAIKQSLLVRSKRGNIAGLAKDVGVNPQGLEAFVFGSAKLPAEVLDKLARALFDATYDPAVDRMRPLQKSTVIPSIGANVLNRPVVTNCPPRVTAPPPKQPSTTAAWPKPSAGFIRD